MIANTRSKGPRRPNHRRGGAKGQVLGIANAPATRARVAATAAGKAAPTNKIIVSNLPPDVNEAQVKVRSQPYRKYPSNSLISTWQELFAATVGPLKEVTLHYDSNGRSKGVAAVQFSRPGDGTKAFQQYNNRLIDGS